MGKDKLICKNKVSNLILIIHPKVAIIILNQIKQYLQSEQILVEFDRTEAIKYDNFIKYCLINMLIFDK